jgi:MFS family permease
MIPLRKNRDFRLLWLGEAASMLGTQLSGVAFPLLVLALTGSPFRAGLVGTVGLAPMALLSLPFGVVADRIDRKWALVCANVVGALALLSLGVAIWIGELAYGYILAVAFVAGCVTTFVRIAEEGVIAQIVPRPQLGEAVSQNVARQYAAGLVGPAVGGVTFAASRALPFVVDAATYLCSLAAVLGIRGRFQEERTHSVVTPWEDVREGVRWLWRQPFLRDSLLLVAGSNVVPTSLLLIVAAKDLGASPAVVGIVLALYSAGGLAGSAAVPWMQPRIPVPVVVSGAVWVDAAVFLVLAFVGTPLLLGVVVAITAFVGPLWDAVVVGYRISITPDRLQGRVASVDWFLSVSLSAVGPLIAGYLLSTIDTRATLLAVAGLLAVLAALGTAAPSLRHPPPSVSLRR